MNFSTLTSSQSNDLQKLSAFPIAFHSQKGLSLGKYKKNLEKKKLAVITKLLVVILRSF